MKQLIFAAFLIAVSALPAAAQMSMTNPPPMTAEAVANSSAGTKIYFVFRVDRLERTTAVGHVLDPAGEREYRMTPSSLSLHVPNDIPVVMGSRDDIKAGAVVFVYGVATKPKAADASKLVVITPYVKVD
jgi:hypothetical protein